MKIHVQGLSVATILYSLVGLFVKLISLPAETIAFARAAIAFVTLSAFLVVTRINPFKLKKPFHLLPFLFLDIFVGGNWFFCFLAIKVSTVAVAVVSLFTYPFITSIIEPFFLKKSTTSSTSQARPSLWLVCFSLFRNSSLRIAVALYTVCKLIGLGVNFMRSVRLVLLPAVNVY